MQKGTVLVQSQSTNQLTKRTVRNYWSIKHLSVLNYTAANTTDISNTIIEHKIRTMLFNSCNTFRYHHYIDTYMVKLLLMNAKSLLVAIAMALLYL